MYSFIFLLKAFLFFFFHRPKYIQKRTIWNNIPKMRYSQKPRNRGHSKEEPFIELESVNHRNTNVVLHCFMEIVGQPKIIRQIEGKVKSNIGAGLPMTSRFPVQFIRQELR